MKGMFFIVSIALLLALAPLPISYYFLLRWIVTIVAVFVITQEYNTGKTIWLILFGITALLFNPIIPIYLYRKSLWMPIDIVASILFISYSLKKQ